MIILQTDKKKRSDAPICFCQLPKFVPNGPKGKRNQQNDNRCDCVTVTAFYKGKKRDLVCNHFLR